MVELFRLVRLFRVNVLGRGRRVDGHRLDACIVIVKTWVLNLHRIAIQGKLLIRHRRRGFVTNALSKAIVYSWAMAMVELGLNLSLPCLRKSSIELFVGFAQSLSEQGKRLWFRLLLRWDEMRASREEKGRYLDERVRIMVRWNRHVGKVYEQVKEYF